MLIHACRFDLMAKYLYIKYKEKNIKSSFFKELYHKHLITFNNCYELPDLHSKEQIDKTNIETFINNFDKLIESIKFNGFNKKYPIPMGNNNIIINGAHRLIVCYYFNIIPEFIKINENGNTSYNYSFFLNRKPNPPLDKLYADSMALEYIKHNPKIRTMIVYPTAFNSEKLLYISKIISEYGYIYYSKSAGLSKKGINNLVKELYRGEEWIGGLFPSGFSPGGKSQRCFTDIPHPTIIILIEMKDTNKLVELKEKCRAIFNIGKHSLHISDFQEDTFRVASSLLNNNSIDFLNNGTNDVSENTKNLLTKYFDKIKNNNEDFCLTSSLIMEMYGLRQAKDIDYLHKDNMEINLKDVGLHSGKWENYYHIHKDEIIYNPENHFYFNGFKFATLNVIKKMKEKRGEPKDINDIKLINK